MNTDFNMSMRTGSLRFTPTWTVHLTRSVGITSNACLSSGKGCILTYIHKDVDMTVRNMKTTMHGRSMLTPNFVFPCYLIPTMPFWFLNQCLKSVTGMDESE